MKVEQIIIAPADIELSNKLQDEMVALSGELQKSWVCRIAGSQFALAI